MTETITNTQTLHKYLPSILAVAGDREFIAEMSKPFYKNPMTRTLLNQAADLVSVENTIIENTDNVVALIEKFESFGFLRKEEVCYDVIRALVEGKEYPNIHVALVSIAEECFHEPTKDEYDWVEKNTYFVETEHHIFVYGSPAMN